MSTFGQYFRVHTYVFEQAQLVYSVLYLLYLGMAKATASPLA
jgi:hypothetical protein